jgi:hypothetical protein
MEKIIHRLWTGELGKTKISGAKRIIGV